MARLRAGATGVNGVFHDGRVVADEVDALRARVAELEAGEVTTEYAVRWPAAAPHGPDADHDDQHEVHGTRESAERVAAMYRHEGAELVQCEVRRGPWAVSA